MLKSAIKSGARYFKSDIVGLDAVALAPAAGYKRLFFHTGEQMCARNINGHIDAMMSYLN